ELDDLPSDVDFLPFWLSVNGKPGKNTGMKPAQDTYFRYFAVSPMDEDWGIYVTTAGYVNVPPGGIYPPPGHPEGYEFFYQNGRVLHEFQLHYVTRGGGDFESATAGPQKIEAGTVFMLFPGEWHRYTATPET